jgi:hypothetical protein
MYDHGKTEADVNKKGIVMGCKGEKGDGGWEREKQRGMWEKKAIILSFV